MAGKYNKTKRVCRTQQACDGRAAERRTKGSQRRQGGLICELHCKNLRMRALCACNGHGEVL